MFWKTIWLGVCRKCPSCGKAGIYEAWAHLRVECPNCQNPIQAREPDTWFFMYVSTAAISGLFIIAMILINPENQTLGRWLLAIAAIVFIVGSIPQRKGIAIALDYIIKNIVK